MTATTTAVTFLFTDLQGSARLWEAEPAKMAGALAEHDRCCRTAVETHGGRLVKMTGDGLHAAFADPAAAILTALELQLGITAIAQACGVPLRMRCGMHAGIAQARDDDYFGSAVNRAARVMNAAHGGQVLLTQAVVDLAKERLPDPIGLVRLGRVRLRDLATPEEVWQLSHPELPAVFPALRSLDSTPNNLPQQSSSFVGRDGELEDARRRLDEGRLVTLTGPGGIGKTRLALQLAAEVLDDYPDGVWLAELSALADASWVDKAVASAFGLAEEVGRALDDQLAAFVATRRLLLVLDNCEHLLSACAVLVDRLLRAGPGVRILATSREPLRVSGERVCPVPPLSIPDERADATPQAAGDSVAVRLFVERARECQPAFALSPLTSPAVSAICRQLDGIPLALELAAAWVHALSVDEISERLADRFRLLVAGTRNAMPRHQTLEAAVAWSHDLLSDHERRLFARLAVFAGGFDLAAAESVAGAPPLANSDVLNLVAGLVYKSLLTVVPKEAGDTRYRLLDTMRAFALARLVDSGEELAMRDRHADHYALAASVANETAKDAARGAAFAALDTDLDNLRLALQWQKSQPYGQEKAADLVLAMSDFLHQRGHLREDRQWLEAVVALPAFEDCSQHRARLRFECANAAFFQGDLVPARRWYELALEDRRALGDRKGSAKALAGLGQVLGRQGDVAAARQALLEAIAIHRDVGDRVNEAKALINLAVTVYMEDAFAEARAYVENALAIAAAGGMQSIELAALLNLAAMELEQDDFDAAHARYQRAHSLARSIGNRYVETLAYGGIGQTHLARHAVAEARAIGAEILETFAAADQRGELAMAFEDTAQIAALDGDPVAAARLWGAAAAWRKSLGSPASRSETARIDARMAAARSSCGEATFEAARSEGSLWSFERTLDEVRQRLRFEPAGAPRVHQGAITDSQGEEQGQEVKRRGSNY